VLKQLTKAYKCVRESLIIYFTTANALLKRFAHVEIKHIPRIENQEVNDLAQMASGYKVSKDQAQEPIEIRNKRSSKESPPKKLLTPKFGGMESSYKHLQGNELFKKNPEGVLLKCLGETEAYLAISNTYSGPCGTHQAGLKMKWLLFRQGVY
jgi:hypothetical protein